MANDSEAIRGLCYAREHDIIDAVLVGEKAEIEKAGEEAEEDLSQFEIIDRPDMESTIEESVRLINDGEGDILMKGRVPTGSLLKRVLDRKYNLRGDRILSHVSVFTSPSEERLILLSDAGINISPDIGRKKDIILNAVSVARSLGIELPKVAMLSYIEKVQAPHSKSALDASILAKMNHDGNIPGCIVEGPLALDNALSPDSVRIKGIEGEVKGQADILIAHDINMGNVIHKTLQIWVKCVIAGVVVGCRTPIILTSRADGRESKLQSIALAILLIQNGYKLG